jgi:hypothetical protein
MHRSQFVASIAMLALTAACSSNPTVSPLASASDLDRVSCGAITVQPNATAGAVLSSCGQPSYRDAWGAAAPAQGPNLASVEEWYYNAGPERPVQVLRFLNGQLISVKQDGLGFDAGKTAKSCDPQAVSRGLSKYRLVQACGDPLTRQAYIVDPSYLLPNAPVFSQGNATIVGQGNQQPVYREDLAYKLGGTVQTVTLQNGRVLTVGLAAGRG